MLKFFTAQITNEHTRKAYLNATRRFSDRCANHGLQQLDQVQAFHIAAFVKDLQGQFTPPTVKLHLAAIRMLFDWLVIGHVTDTNPAHAVRGSKYVVQKGKTGRGEALWQQDAYRMTQRRAAAAGIATEIGSHAFRATSITAYLKNKGALEPAHTIANHSWPRTTKLFDRRSDETSLDEVENFDMTGTSTIAPMQHGEAQQRCLKRATRCASATRYKSQPATISRAAKWAGAA